MKFAKKTWEQAVKTRRTSFQLKRTAKPDRYT